MGEKFLARDISIGPPFVTCSASAQAINYAPRVSPKYRPPFSLYPTPSLSLPEVLALEARNLRVGGVGEGANDCFLCSLTYHILISPPLSIAIFYNNKHYFCYRALVEGGLFGQRGEERLED